MFLNGAFAKRGSPIFLIRSLGRRKDDQPHARWAASYLGRALELGGHQREHKWFTVVAGEVQVAVVKPDDWPSPSSDLPVARYVLYAARPQVLS